MDPTPEAIRALAHDLRNLLTAIRGHAELALNGMDAARPGHQDVAQLMVVTAAAFELIDQLDRDPSRLRPLVPNVDGALIGWQPLFAAMLTPTIDLQVRPGAPGMGVPIARPRLERIMLNLVVNARNAMPDGGKLTILSTAGRDGNVTIGVADTGGGFTKDALEHLFEVGYTTRRGRGGSGIGLASSRQLVMDAGGSLSVANRPGGGAVIKLSLPGVRRPQRPASDSTPPASDSTPPASDSTPPA